MAEKETVQTKCCTRRLQCVLLVSILIASLFCIGLIGLVHHVKGDGENLNETLSEEAMHQFEVWEAPQDLQEKFKYYLAGYDNQNTAVWIVPFGTYKVRDYLDSAGEEGEKMLEMYTDQFYYRVQKSRHRPRFDSDTKSFISNNNSFVIICDMDDYSNYAVITAAPFLLRMAKKYAVPASDVDYGFVLNLDWFSQILVNMARPILGAALAKLEMFGSDKDEYLERIQSKIPTSQLPPIYGGSQAFKPIMSYGFK